MKSIDNSSNNILSCIKECQLSKNLLGEVFEYCDLTTLLQLVMVDKRFKSTVEKMIIFSYYMGEWEYLSEEITGNCSIFWECDRDDDEYREAKIIVYYLIVDKLRQGSFNEVF